MKEYKYKNVNIKLGTNQKDNHNLLTQYKNTDFIWLHSKNTSSGHCVILEVNPNKEVLEFAGLLIKNNCKEKNNPNCKIEYTKLSNLNIVGIGLVEPISSKCFKI